MASIRFKPKYTVFPQSPEVKKVVSYYRAGKIQLCCIKRPPIIPIINENRKILDGGLAFYVGTFIEDGGLSFTNNTKIYDGGSP